MAAGFKIRKLTPATPIGVRLRRARERKELTIEQLEESTKIRRKFIEALESDRWESIPSEVYGRGYLERYAKELGLPVVTIMHQYEREKIAYSSRCKEASVEFTPRSYRFTRTILTPRLIGGVTALVAVLGFATAAGAQLVKFGQAPFLEVAATTGVVKSGDHMLVATGNTVELAGKTALDAVVVVNGVTTVLSSDGSFSQHVAIRKGVNAIVVQATDGRGKSSSETLSIVAR